jgi:hypothetical protein
MDEYLLIEILEASVAKNGEKPLTNLWLLNILKLYRNQLEERAIFDNLIGVDFEN